MDNTKDTKAVKVTFSMPTYLRDELEQQIKREDRPRSRVLQKAIILYLAQVDSERAQMKND